MKTQTSWLEESVQEFFGRCNWLGNPLEGQNHQATGQPLSLTLSVAQFFRAFAWEGIPEVGAMPVSASLPTASVPEPSEVTIDDLFDLF